MSPMLTTLLVIWAVLTLLLIVLLIYRSTLSMHEEDQLYLDEAEAHMAREQEEIHAKIARISMPVRVLGGASALLILLIVGIFAYQGWTQLR